MWGLQMRYDLREGKIGCLPNCQTRTQCQGRPHSALTRREEPGAVIRALPWPVLVFDYTCPRRSLDSSCRPLRADSGLEMADVEAQIHNVPSPRHQPALASTVANPQLPQSPHSPASPLAATTANPQTTYPIHPRPPNSAFFQSQATGTNDSPHGNAPPSQIAGIQGMLMFFAIRDPELYSRPCSRREVWGLF